MVAGRNFDWMIDDCLLVVNKQNIQKTGFVSRKGARWTSRHGSVTFNQFGREFPLCGMNERGLVIATLWLDETRLPPAGNRPLLTSLQWVQYMLDNCASVSEVIAADARVAIAEGAGSTVHFFVADSTGAAASVEYLNAHAVYHTASVMPYPVLANDAYPTAVEFARTLVPFGGSNPVPTDFSSPARFARAADYLRRYNPADSVAPLDYAFDMLASVSSGFWTKWSAAYDIPNRTITFRTFANQQLRTVNLRDLDFSGRKPALMLDANARLAGDLTARFTPWRHEDNLALVRKVYRSIDFLKGISDRDLDRIAAFPTRTRYTGK
jgi:choloylglycine hydrolase